MRERKAGRDGLLFGAIVLGLSYLVFWGPIAFFKVPTISFVSKVRGPLWAILLYLLGGFVPSLVALFLTAIAEGGPGLRSLLRRSLQFKLGLKSYLFILAVVLAGGAGQLLIDRLLGGAFDFSLYLAQLPSFLPLIVLGPISEEFGWRGYMLPKLEERWGPLPSAVAVGLAWGLWHLPLFYMPGSSQHELALPFLGFLLAMVAQSVIMAFIADRTEQSIWAAIFFHWLYTCVAQVNSTGITRSVAYNWLEFLPYVLIALLVVAIWRPKARLKA